MENQKPPIPAPAVRERMTWEEICARYPDEFVVLIHLEKEGGDDFGRLLSAVVLGHSKERGECLRETRAIRDQERIYGCAYLYTGAPVKPGFEVRRFR